MTIKKLIIGSNPRTTLIRAVCIGVVCFFFFSYVLRPVRVQGESMSPTYKTGGVNFVNCLSYSFSEPQRGDIVTIRMAGTRVMYLKRVIGLPGEDFQIADGQVMINGEPFEEEYVEFRAPWNREKVTLKDNEYYVIGDNRGMEMEQHMQGIAIKKRIVGKVIF